jgi:hypothetical protein
MLGGIPENPDRFPEHEHGKEKVQRTGSNATVRKKEA